MKNKLPLLELEETDDPLIFRVSGDRNILLSEAYNFTGFPEMISPRDMGLVAVRFEKRLEDGRRFYGDTRMSLDFLNEDIGVYMLYKYYDDLKLPPEE